MRTCRSSLRAQTLMLSVKTHKTTAFFEDNATRQLSLHEHVCGMENLRLWLDPETNAVQAMLRLVPEYRDDYLIFYRECHWLYFGIHPIISIRHFVSSLSSLLLDVYSAMSPNIGMHPPILSPQNPQTLTRKSSKSQLRERTASNSSPLPSAHPNQRLEPTPRPQPQPHRPTIATGRREARAFDDGARASLSETSVPEESKEDHQGS